MLRLENSTEHQRTIFGSVFLYERADFCTKNSQYFCQNFWPSIHNCVQRQTQTCLVNIYEISFGSLSTFKFEAWNSTTISNFVTLFYFQKSTAISKTKYLADQLILFQPEGAESVHSLLLAPPNFFTFRHHWMEYTCRWENFLKLINVQTKIRYCK